MKKINNNIWLVGLKVALMSVFATVVSFMLNCVIVVVASEKFNMGDAVATRLLIQFIGIVVQFMFTYGTIWDFGSDDQQRINLGEKTYSRYRGLVAGFIGAIPYYLMTIAMALMSFDLIPDITGLLRTCCSQFWGFYTFLLPVATSVNEAIDPGFAQSVATPVQAISAIIVPTLIPLLCILPYHLGKKGFHIGEKLYLAKK